MGKIQLKISDRHWDRGSSSIKMHYFNRNSGILHTLYNGGESLKGRVPDGREEEIENLLLSVKEPAGPPESEGASHTINSYVLTYYDDPSELGKLSKVDQQKSNREKAIADFILEGHAEFKICDRNGENINANACNDPAWEIRNITQDIRDSEQKNQKIAIAQEAFTHMYNHTNDEDFYEIIYAYELPNIVHLEKQVLYNMGMLKIQTNPEYFLNLVNNKDRQLISLVERAINVEVENSNGGKSVLIVCKEDGTYFLNGDPIGRSKEDIIDFLKVNEDARKSIEIKLGVRNAFLQKTSLIKDGESPAEYIEEMDKDASEEKKLADMRILIARSLERGNKKQRQTAINNNRAKYKKMGMEEQFDLILSQEKEKYPSDDENG